MAKLQSGTHVYGNTTIDTTLSMGGAILGNLINQSYNQGTGSLQIGGNTAIAGTTVVQNLILQGNNNLLLQSNGFGTSPWITVANTTLTSAYAVAPDGTVSAYKINTASGNVANGIYQTVTKATYPASLPQAFTFSTYAKAAGYTWLQIKITDGTGANGYNYWFDVSNNAVGNTATLGTGYTGNVSSISSASTTGSGWYRCSASFTTSSNTQVQCYLIPTNANGTTTLGDSNLDGIYVWGSQLELGNTASAYTNTAATPISSTNNLYVPTGQIFANTATNVQGANYPAYSFTNSPKTGISWDGNNLQMTINGATPFQITQNGIYLNNGYGVYIGATTSLQFNQDTILVRDGIAGILALRYSTNPHGLRIYNTYTDASNYERLALDWQTTENTFSIGTQAAGTGTLRNISLVGGNVTIQNTTASTTNATGALIVAGGIGVAGNVYMSQNSTIGFSNTTNSLVRQYYNTVTNSLDTVFG